MNRLVNFVVLVTVAYGRIATDDEDSITNGNLAEIEDFPYYAILTTNGRRFCGGAFIERDLVLTAAHCLLRREITVYAGITKLSNLKKAKGYRAKYDIPNFSFFLNRNSANDIGLIKLREKIKLGKKAQVIRLPTKAPPVGEAGIVVGFGLVKCKGSRCSELNRTSNHLRYADLVFEKIEPNGIIHTRNGDNKATCYGDSGGPIVYNGTIVGIVSQGEFDNCTGYGVQAPVVENLDWIAEALSMME